MLFVISDFRGRHDQTSHHFPFVVLACFTSTRFPTPSHLQMNSAVVALKRALRKDIKAQLQSLTPATLATECKGTSKNAMSENAHSLACSTTGR